jgi:hypothetical protein
MCSTHKPAESMPHLAEDLPVACLAGRGPTKEHPQGTMECAHRLLGPPFTPVDPGKLT